MNYHLKSSIITCFIWGLMIFAITNGFERKKEVIAVSLESQPSGSHKNTHVPHKTAGKNGPKEHHHDLDNDNEQHQDSQNLEPVYQPLPTIPDDLRSDAFNSFAIARFYINKDGAVENVELIQPSSNPKLNQLLLKSLKKWKFSATNKAATKDIKVNFEVK